METAIGAPRSGPAGAFARFDQVLGHVIEVAAAAFVVAEVCLLGWATAARYLFDAPLTWSDELATIFFIWLSMLGSVVALRRGVGERHVHQRHARDLRRARLAPPRSTLGGVALTPRGVDQAEFDGIQITGRAEPDALAGQQARQLPGTGKTFIELAQRLGELGSRRLAGLRRVAQLLENAHAELVSLDTLAALAVRQDRGRPRLPRFELGTADDPGREQPGDAQHVPHAVARTAPSSMNSSHRSPSRTRGSGNAVPSVSPMRCRSRPRCKDVRSAACCGFRVHIRRPLRSRRWPAAPGGRLASSSASSDRGPA